MHVFSSNPSALGGRDFSHQRTHVHTHTHSSVLPLPHLSLYTNRYVASWTCYLVLDSFFFSRMQTVGLFFPLFPTLGLPVSGTWHVGGAQEETVELIGEIKCRVVV